MKGQRNRRRRLGRAKYHGETRNGRIPFDIREDPTPIKLGGRLRSPPSHALASPNPSPARSRTDRRGRQGPSRMQEGNGAVEETVAVEVLELCARSRSTPASSLQGRDLRERGKRGGGRFSIAHVLRLRPELGRDQRSACRQPRSGARLAPTTAIAPCDREPTLRTTWRAISPRLAARRSRGQFHGLARRDCAVLTPARKGGGVRADILPRSLFHSQTPLIHCECATSTSPASRRWGRGRRWPTRRGNPGVRASLLQSPTLKAGRPFLACLNLDVLGPRWSGITGWARIEGRLFEGATLFSRCAN